MSMNSNIISSTFGLNVDPDHRQDRTSGKMTTRKMTKEEIERYENLSPTKKPIMAGVGIMTRKDDYMKAKINRERLLEICEDGFTANAYREAAKEFGVTPHTIQCYVSTNKLNKDADVEKDKPMKEIKSNTKIETGLGLDSIVEDELEILNQIKSIVKENKVIKEENKTLADGIARIKSALEDILKSIA